MNDNVSKLGATMVTDEHHVPSEEAVLRKPSVQTLPGVAPFWLVRRFDDACWTEQCSINLWVIVHMDVTISCNIGRPTAQESMPLWNDCFVVVQRCVEANGVAM